MRRKELEKIAKMKKKMKKIKKINQEIKQSQKEKKEIDRRCERTTFAEHLGYVHIFFSRALKPWLPTTALKNSLPIPPPTSKYCPVRLSLWKDFPVRQQEVYGFVCNYFQPTEDDPK
ncbi:hypothetical protein V1514DRAFT_331246 [Lipomyces japonicus]|uniref:uncharacterized protein n=1 Tax=Lipomyces japonicus TaxID=56871 RepID=UPI0034D00654